MIDVSGIMSGLYSEVSLGAILIITGSFFIVASAFDIVNGVASIDKIAFSLPEERILLILKLFIFDL